MLPSLLAIKHPIDYFEGFTTIINVYVYCQEEHSQMNLSTWWTKRPEKQVAAIQKRFYFCPKHQTIRFVSLQ